MTRRAGLGATLGAVLAVAVAGLAGCSDTPELGILTPYGEGYSDGCDSGYADIGVPGFERAGGGGSLFGGGYGSGWEKGYADCQNFMRAAAL